MNFQRGTSVLSISASAWQPDRRQLGRALESGPYMGDDAYEECVCRCGSPSLGRVDKGRGPNGSSIDVSIRAWHSGRCSLGF